MKPYSVLFVLLSFFFIKQMVAQELPKHSNEVLQEAYRQAAADKKNVFLMFHASWCGWCHKLDSSMNDKTVRDFFNSNYVIKHLTVYESKDKKNLENPGALEFLTKYKGNDLGIPYWIILDKNGNWLADSQVRPDGSDYTMIGENVGCPASREEVNHFLKVLGKTSSLNTSQRADIEKRFLRNQ
ncbi:MAG: thioredoxin family protein [Chitinophagaceae bacterium]|nr:thioredoxin family protein [Chitinophagaceae bacterium]